MRKADGSYTGGAIAAPALLGAGGYITAGVEIADDGWMICGGDAIGCWVRGPSDNKWTPLITSTLLPAGYYGVDRVQGVPDGPMGAWANDICKSDSSKGWMVVNGYLWKITNLNNSSRALARITSGGPWSSTGSTDNNSLTPGRMRCDPQNASVVAFGTRQNKLVVTTNGGTSITEVAVAAGNAQIQVDVDPTSTVTGGILQRWFCTQPGVGILMSTSGPAGPYSAVSGAPANVHSIHCDAQGNCWALAKSATNNLYKWTSGTGVFSAVNVVPQPSNGSYEFMWIATDPATSGASQHIVLNGNSGLAQSYDGGATWIGIWNQAKIGAHTYIGSTSIAWQGTYPAGGSKAGANTNPTNGWSWGKFTKTGGRLVCATGIGVYEAPTQPTACSSSEANTFRFYEKSEGLDMLLTVAILYPPGGKPIYATWDRLAIKINDREKYRNQPNGYRYGEIDGSGNPYYSQLNHCSSLAYVPGHPEVICASMWLNNQVHCVSYDYGDTWTKKIDHPDGFSVWGMIVPVDLNTAFWFPSAGGRPVYTTNLSASTPTWNTFTGTGAGIPFPVKASVLIGSGNGQLILKSAANYAPVLVGSANQSAQFITVTINAASGAGSVVDNAGAKTCVVTPPSGTTTATQLATYINANSTLITATPTGTGASAFSTGTVGPMTYDPAIGHSPFDTAKRFMKADANGNLVFYSYGPGNEAATYRGIWILPYGADPNSGWVRYVSSTFPQGDAGQQIDFVPNGTSAPTEFYAKGYSFFTTNGLSRSVGGAAWSTVALTSHVTTVAVGPVPPGKSRPAIAFAGKYNSDYGIWIWEGTTPGTDAPRKLISYPLDNPDSVLELCFNPRAYDPTAPDQTLLWGGFGTSGGFSLTYADSKSLT